MQVWRDLDQDGVSAVGELQSLSGAGITGIQLNSAADIVRFANGNVQTASSAFSRADGTTGKIANLDLMANGFYREFGTKIPLTDEAAKLPALRGAGMVRDLREAASLDAKLVDEVNAFRGLSRVEMMDRLDQFLQDWAHTSEFRTSMQQVADMGMTLLFQVPGVSKAEMRAIELGGQPACADSSGSVLSSLAISDERYKIALAQVTEMGRIIDVLEAFNGQTLLTIPEDHKMIMANGSGVSIESPTPSGFNVVSMGQDGIAAVSNTAGVSATFGSGIFVVAPIVWANQAEPLKRGYLALRDSVYGALIEVRLKDYIDTVELKFDVNGVSFDFTNLDAALDRAYQADPIHTFVDCLDLQKCCDVLSKSGWQGSAKLVSWVADLTEKGQLEALKAGLATAFAKSSSVPEIKVGTSNSETLLHFAKDAILVGLAGNDYLIGGEGNDLLAGGSGNDGLNGGAGDDMYLFGRGGGQDSVNNYDVGIGKTDVISFAADISPTDLSVTRKNDDLIFGISGTSDRLAVSRYFDLDANGASKLEEIRFADGTVWTIDAIKAMVQRPTGGSDVLYGYAIHDVLRGGEGADTIYGNAGDDELNGEGGRDFLYGGDGSDVLYGGVGDDFLEGGLGNDTVLGQYGNDALRGADGNDILIGGAGSDTLFGDAGSDVYLFSRGDGQDRIYNYDSSVGKTDAIQFSGDIVSTNVSIARSEMDLVLSIAGSTDKLTIVSYFDSDATAPGRLEEVRFGDGSVWTINMVKAMVQVATGSNDLLYGYTTDDALSGADGNDTIYGNAGNDALDGEAGRDLLYGEAGNDVLSGGRGDDVLNGGPGNDLLLGQEGNDSLRGDEGIDFLRGGAGNDFLYDWSGVSFFDGGTGNDILTGAAASEVYIGGYGNDTFDTGAGNDLILFDKGDGQDTFVCGGIGSDTLSVGGSGLNYDDMALAKFGDDLVLLLGDYDQMTFKAWYAPTSAKPVSTLQVIAEGMVDFVQGGPDPLKDQKIETFDFKGLVSAFDQARASSPGMGSWALNPALPAFQTGGSDTLAMGGDIAWQYGRNGSLDLIGTSSIFDTMSAGGFGSQPQIFHG